MGVVSRSTDKSLRLFNNQDQYDRWKFIAGQARVVGKPLVVPGGIKGPPPTKPDGGVK